MAFNALLLFGILFLLFFLGFPISFSILGSGVVFLATTGISPMMQVAQRTYIGLNSFTLLAIPLFMLCGYIMEYASLSKRLVEWVEAIFGRVAGSTGVVTIIACTIFAALTGSGPATVAAIGAIMWPALINSGYSKSTAAGIISCAGALGPIIPPSIGMIVYGSLMNVSVPKMFMAALVPGLLMSLGMVVLNMILAKTKWKLTPTQKRYTAKEKLALTWKALPTLMLPVIILGGIYGGVFTPSEAGCVGCVYALILGLYYRTINIHNIVSIFAKAAENSGACLCIGGFANLFAYILSATQMPAHLTEAVVSVVNSPTAYLLILFAIMLVAGAVMESLSIIYILAPIIIPIGVALGLDPLHLSMAFCLNMCLGIVTPPFGVNLFCASTTTGESFGSVVKGVWPFMLIMVGVVFLITFVPQVSMWLPNLLYGP